MGDVTPGGETPHVTPDQGRRTTAPDYERYYRALGYSAWDAYLLASARMEGARWLGIKGT